MNRVGIWSLGLVVSASFHAAVGIVLVLAYLPGDVPSQQKPESQLQLDTVEAPRETAKAQAPDAPMAEQAAADETSVNAGAVPSSNARPLSPDAPKEMPVSAAGATLQASAAQPLDLAASDADPPAIAALSPPPDQAASMALPSSQVAEAEPQSEIADPVSAPDAASPITAETPPARPADALAAKAPMLASSRPDTTAAAQPPLPVQRTRASTAWQFSDRVVTDPKAIATIQAFMTPEALDNAAANAGEVRDNLASILKGVDCARVSAVYLPEKGALELRGHVPSPDLQAPLLAAMRGAVGQGVPVTANLRYLPKPQCGALTGIAAVGLPQSTDQFTNKRLIGETAQARDYSYTEGQRLQFDLSAPDYDAFVYVDYFNADGDVIHLIPNQTIPLKEFAAKSTVGVGQDRAGKPGLRITIGPPYGQEIAVAFAASDRLYDGLRPISEPAAPYLDFLKKRVADARAADPHFKGEWVYFFITTSPATQ